MIYMINSIEFQETNGFYSLTTDCKPKSRKLEKTVPHIQIALAKLNQWLLFAWK